MIILKLDEMLDKRNMTAYALHKVSGLHQSVISKIRHNKSKALQLDVLNKLCESLECLAGDLIVYQGKDATQGVKATQSAKATQSVNTQKGNTELSKTGNAPAGVPKLRKVADGMLSLSDFFKNLK
jgi:putative transcriptional regulator